MTKKLNLEELEKVSGGDLLQDNDNLDVIVFYREVEDGPLLNHNLGDVLPPEEKAKEWCSLNNKIYAFYQRGKGSTNSYDTKLLLDSISVNKG